MEFGRFPRQLTLPGPRPQGGSAVLMRQVPTETIQGHGTAPDRRHQH